MQGNLYQESEAVAILPPVAVKTSQGWNAMALSGGSDGLILIGIGAYTDGAFQFTMQEGDGTTMTDVDPSDVMGTLPNFSDDSLQGTLQALAYIGSQPYIALGVTVTGAPASGCVITVLGVVSNPPRKPLHT